MKHLLTVLTVLVLAMLAPLTAHAYVVDTELDRVSDYFSQGRTVEVRCTDSIAEWESPAFLDEPGAGPDVFGITDMYDRWIAMQPRLCDRAHHVADDTRDPVGRALAVLTVVHESLHAKGRWNEAAVECDAIRNFRLGAMMLGATWRQANDLLRYGMGWHKLIARKGTAYYSPRCKVPKTQAIAVPDGWTWDED